jgi:ATP-dependent DNA helicase RecG
MLNSKTPVFEELHASKLKTTLELITALDYANIFRLLNKPVPTQITN